MSAPDLEDMRAFLANVLCDRAGGPTPPLAMVKANHLGPIAYRRGVRELRAEYAASTIMADRRARTLREVVRAFGKVGIDVALMKGISFVGNVYPDPAERPMHDIDLLVRPTQLPEAIAAILGLGFVRVGFERKLSDYYHAVVFCRGDMMVELHRHIMQRYRTRMPIAELWQRARPDDQGTGALRLDRVDELLLCILHIARHELAIPAINYVDVRRLWNRLDAAQRETLATRARAYRISRSIDAVLAMTELLASGDRGAPEIGPGSTILPATDAVLVGARPERLRQIAQKLFLTEGGRERLGLGFSYVAAIVEGWYRGRAERQR